jgi:hypothetical protein
MPKKTLILLAFILIKFLLQYVLLSPEYDLQRDEYLHLDQGNHPAFGFISVPPVTSWLSFIIGLLGNGVFWIKFVPALFGALTMLVVWKTIEALKGGLYALILGATGVLLSVILRLNTLYQPNSLDVLCWTAFYFTIIQYISTERPRWLYAGAVVFAIGFLNKYNMVFLPAGLFPALLFSGHRRLFARRELYAAILLGLMLIAPNLVWQYNNQFPVVHHLKELADTQLVNVDRSGFLTSQLLFFAGSLPVIAAGLYGLLFYPPFRPYRLFVWTMVFTLALFIYFRAKDYYAIGLYPVYIAFGAVYAEHLLRNGWKRYLRPVFAALPVLFFIPMYHYVFPNKPPAYIIANNQRYKELGLLRWEDGKDHALPQDFADMLGWKELAEKVDSLYAAMPAPGNTLVLCDNYGQAGAINYYTQHNIKAVSFNADYINWFHLDQPYAHLIRVKDRRSGDTELEKTSPYFERGFLADSVSNPYSREYRTPVFVFIGAKVNINNRLKEEIAEKKARR